MAINFKINDIQAVRVYMQECFVKPIPVMLAPENTKSQKIGSGWLGARKGLSEYDIDEHGWLSGRAVKNECFFGVFILFQYGLYYV